MALGLWFLLALISGVREATAQVVYQWNPNTLYERSHPANGTNPFRFNTDWIDRPDGGKSLQVTVPPDRSTNNYWDFIVVNPNPSSNPPLLQSGMEYRATIKFQVMTSTAYPRYFYMYVRNSAGTAHDQWRKIVDDPGTTRTVEFPFDLKTIGTDNKWTFKVGMLGTGSIIIDSFNITAGSGYTATAATPIPKILASAKPAIAPASDATGIPIATGGTPISVAAPAMKGDTIIASDLKAEGTAGADPTVNFNALNAYLRQCKASGTSKLLIPTGVYRINSTADINMDGFHDLVIDGQSSEFIIEGWRYGGNLFLINNSAKLVFKNLKIDWNWHNKPLASLCQLKGYSETVEANGAVSKILDLTFPDLTAAQTLKLTTDSSITWLGMAPFDATRLVQNGVEKNNIPNSYPSATSSKYPSMAFSNVVGNSFTVKMTPQPNNAFALALQVGNYYCIRHMYYDMLAFKIHNSTDMLFDGFTIYSWPGMGWLINTKTHHLKINNCAIIRRPGARTPYTTSADGFHTSESQGNIELSNCFFTGSGDDSINVHSNCWQGGLEVGVAADTLKFRNLPNYKLRVASGDVLEFYKADYAPYDPLIRLTVKAVSYSGTDADITFTQPAPKLPFWSIVRNLTYNSENIRIVDCNFIDTNGRAILLSADSVSITNCTFRNVFSTPIQIQTDIVDNAWAEGFGAKNLLIKNSTFENCNTHGRWDGAIIYAGAVLPWGITKVPLFNTVLVEGNRFVNPPGPSLSFTSSKNIVARNNTIEFSQNIAGATRYSGALFTSNTTNVALGGNKWVYSANLPYGNPAVVTDVNTTSDIRPAALPLNSNVVVLF